MKLDAIIATRAEDRIAQPIYVGDHEVIRYTRERLGLDEAGY